MRLLKISEVTRVTGVPKSSVYWRAAQGQFPRPIKIGPRASAWQSDEIEAWIAARIAARDRAAA